MNLLDLIRTRVEIASASTVRALEAEVREMPAVVREHYSEAEIQKRVDAAFAARGYLFECPSWPDDSRGDGLAVRSTDEIMAREREERRIESSRLRALDAEDALCADAGPRPVVR